MPDNAAAVAFLRGLRIAATTIAAAVVLVLGMTRFLPHLQDFRPPTVQVVGHLVLISVVAIDALLVARDRFWGRWRWPAIAAVLAADAAMVLSLPAENPFDNGETAYAAVGWLGVLLLFDQPLRTLLIFLGVHVLGSAALLVNSGVTDRQALLALGVATVGICALQLAVGIATVALRRVATDAVTAARQEEDIRTREAVAARLHLDRQQRYEELARTARPLLTGLADGSVDPTDEAAQRRCAVEAARMRRLFAEADDVEDPLLHELRACIDVAERKGIVVTLATSGRWPTLSREQRRAITDAPLSVLATATSTARVTVVGTRSTVAVSVVADAAYPDIPPPPTLAGVQVTTMQEESEWWVEARWTPNPS